MTLRAILLEQFRNAWNKEDWYAPVAVAIEGLTAKHAMWKPADSVHSVGELAYRLYRGVLDLYGPATESSDGRLGKSNRNL